MSEEDRLRQLVEKLLRQQGETELYIRTIARELEIAASDRDRAWARVRVLEAAAAGCIPVEVIDIPTLSRAKTREVES